MNYDFNNASVKPPIDQESLSMFDSNHKAPLGKSLNELLLKFNGSSFDEYVIQAPNDKKWLCYTMHEKYFRVYSFFSLDEIQDRIESITEHCLDYEIDVESPLFFLNSMIPFTEVDGFNPLCIVTKGDDEGKIYLVEWYFHHQNNGSLPFPRQLVADSFEEFLSMLSLADEDVRYKKAISSY
ncbi:SMI1/KNR4 family protein [Fibrisoma limi]|uniref:SMI1/KNR4 family protein n=1 Tax=Fibrisoma limi TaxID=663275 RepID=UPI00118183E9|nr:SMI1/KNR4 family protein [Fibrisoma limi]